MRLVAFTYPEFFEKEAALIREVLPVVDSLHIRKNDDASRQDWIKLLKAIPSEWRSRVWIHDHYDMAATYKLGGIHLTRTFLARFSCGLAKQLGRWKKTGSKLSATCHSIGELDKLASWADVVFIAPVFDSISKPGHASQWDLATWSVPNIPDTEIIALGGVNEEHIPLLKEKGFDGVAVLGALWGSDDPVKKVKKLKNTCKTGELTY